MCKQEHKDDIMLINEMQLGGNGSVTQAELFFIFWIITVIIVVMIIIKRPFLFCFKIKSNQELSSTSALISRVELYCLIINAVI